MGDGAMPQDHVIAAREPWRESVLRGMLTIAAIITPVIALLALFIAPGSIT